MHEHLGEEYSGLVSSVTSFGIFVTLDAMYVEGLVHITELGGDYYRFDEARQELRGERTGMRYAIGTRLQVQVSRVDLDGRRIDFRLVQEGAGLVARAMKDKGLARESEGRFAKQEVAKGLPPKRGQRKISEPMANAAHSPPSGAKAAPRTPGVKAKDKSKKPRRRT
jgi:ribonuclease R